MTKKKSQKEKIMTENIKPTVFINFPGNINSYQLLKLLWHKYVYHNYFAPPMITFERSYWYKERWEVMCSSEGGRKTAVPTICGWCGQNVPAYPLRLNHSGGTHCHECDRTVDESYLSWLYRAEYLDGCHATYYQPNGISSGGPKHAPHIAFIPNDIPIYEFLSPILVQYNNNKIPLKDIRNFFRTYIKSRGCEFPKSPITDLISLLPTERDVPHQEEKKEPKDRSNELVSFSPHEFENFDGNMFTAHLVPKNNPTWGATRSSALSAENRDAALEQVKKDIKEQKIIDNLDDYEIYITNGIALSWHE